MRCASKQESQRPPKTRASSEQLVSEQKKICWLTEVILFGFFERVVVLGRYYESNVELGQFYLQ